MSKSNRKCTFRRYSPFLYVFVLVVLGSTLILTGCGELSLNQLLENQEPGELGISPASANLPVDTSVTVRGMGGFQPYAYEKLSGGGSIDPITGIFTAPSASDTVTVEVTDYFGEKAQGTLTIFDQLRLFYSGAQVSHLTVVLSDLPLTFVAVDGVSPYVFSVQGATGSISASGVFDASAPGEYMIEVSDSLENSAVATVNVLDLGGPLTISPEVAYVLVGQTIEFTAYNHTPNYTFSVQGPTDGSITPDTNPATYTAPADPTVDTIIFSDDLGTVSATVHVLSADLNPLVISPASFSEDLGSGQEVLFTVSGGLLPYTFWLEYDGAHGTLEKLSATQARYTAPDANTVDWVWVKDALDTELRVKVKVSAQ